VRRAAVRSGSLVLSSSSQSSTVERAKVKRYASAYKGPQQALVAKYVAAMDGQ